MSIKYSTGTVTNGLVFAWDKDNQKSYKGPLIQNLAQTIIPHSTSGTGISYTTGYSDVKIPTLGVVANVPYVDGYNSNSASYCCMNQLAYNSSDVSVSGSTTYTYAILYKSTSGYTGTNFMYRYEYSPSAYVTEAGVFDTSKQVHLGDQWYWAWNTFTTQASTTRLTGIMLYYYQYNVSDRVYVAKVLLTPGNYTGVHPRLWPDLGTTRAATTSIYDLMGSSTSSAAALGYDSSGSPTFDGSSNYIRWNNNTNLDTSTPTVEVWIKTNSTNQNGFWFEKGAVNTQYSLFQENTSIAWRHQINGVGLTTLYTSTSPYINTSNWFHVVGTYSSGSRKLYVNGVLVNSDTQTGSVATNTSGMFMGEYGGGGYRYNGQIAMVKVYNRALLASEVLQNFNASKGRFGY